MGTKLKRRLHRKIGTERVVAERGAPERPPIKFRDTDVETLRVGDVPLGEYLEGVGQGWVLRLRERLEAADVSSLVASYQPNGRHALHPRRLLGLIVYGMLVGQWSLRGLETLARRDLGAIWICGGAQPDHSAIGEFVLRHATALSEDLFVSVTREIVVSLKMSASLAAADGTVIEAATSRFRTLKLQAAEAARDRAAAAAAERPEDPGAAAALEKAAEAAHLARERTEARREKDPEAREAPVAPGEPEAVVQPRKDGAVRPAYKPSIQAHPSRLIVGQHVEPSSETAAVLPLLIQHVGVFGARPTTQLLDAGYFSLEVLALFFSLEMDLLCPEGKTTGGGGADSWAKRRAPAFFDKSEFRYDAAANVYHCPAGQLLRPRGGTEPDRHGQRFRRYDAKDCGGCALRVRCTESPRGRQVRRYEGEELKEGMREVLAQPAARRRYRRRQASVEPVYSELRGRQGLTRFHRRGLRKVRAEFGLHCIAYNLRRAIRLEARACLLRVTLPTPWGPQPLLVLVVFIRRASDSA